MRKRIIFLGKSLLIECSRNAAKNYHLLILKNSKLGIEQKKMQTIKRFVRSDNGTEAILAFGIVMIGLLLATVFITFP